MIKVLVIDDQESIKTGLTLLLKKKGFYAKSAESAEEALPLIEKEIFNYIISDLSMPGLSGIEFATELNKRSYPARVILVSAYFSVEDAIEALRLKVCDMFAKPVDNNLIINRIEELDREKNVNRVDLDLATRESGKFKFIRSFADNVLLTNYYNNSLNSFKFICHRIDQSIMRYCIISNVSNEMFGYIRCFFEFFNILDSDFFKIEDFFEKISSFNYIQSSDIGVLFGEINTAKNKMKVFVRGNIGVSVASLNKNDVTLFEIDNIFKELSEVKDYYILVYNKLKNEKHGVTNRSTTKDDFSLGKDLFLFDEFQILNFMNDFPLVDSNSSFMLLQSLDFHQNKEFCFDVFIESLNLEHLFEFIKIHLEFYMVDQELKVVLLSSIAEIISRLYHNNYKQKFQILLLVFPGKEVKVRITGDDLNSYIDLTRDIKLKDLVSFSEDFSFIGFDDILVSDKMVEIGALLQ